MTWDAYGLKTTADRYEVMIEKDMWRILKAREFHIQQLRVSIDAADELLDIVAEEIEEWSETIKEVYSIDDAHTWLDRLQLFLMKKYVNFKQSHACREAVEVWAQRERLVRCLKILCPTYESKSL